MAPTPHVQTDTYPPTHTHTHRPTQIDLPADCEDLLRESEATAARIATQPPKPTKAELKARKQAAKAEKDVRRKRGGGEQAGALPLLSPGASESAMTAGLSAGDASTTEMLPTKHAV